MSDRHQQLVGQLERLADLTLYDLREEWRRLYRMQPPSRLSRDLLTRGIAYRLQEQAFGGLPKSILRRMRQASSKDAKDLRRSGAPPVIKPGTRLVREWRGVTHSVLVHADHVEWNGKRYRSLSDVARAITGARWSGPRFFGLRNRSATTPTTPTATVPVGPDARPKGDAAAEVTSAQTSSELGDAGAHPMISGPSESGQLGSGSSAPAIADLANFQCNSATDAHADDHDGAPALKDDRGLEAIGNARP